MQMEFLTIFNKFKQFSTFFDKLATQTSIKLILNNMFKSALTLLEFSTTFYKFQQFSTMFDKLAPLTNLKLI